MKRIVTIGGGTGHYTLLRGLKSYNVHLDAIVSVADNGGSSGRIRDEFVDFGILPPGDIRNCLLALTDESRLQHMVKLFEHRFPETKGSLSEHNLGNLIIAGAQDAYGGIGEGVQVISKMLGIQNAQVIPISEDPTTLYATTKSGKTLEGQLQVSYPPKGEKIEKTWLKPPAFVYRKAAESIREADMIVICPGDLYGSIIPNFLVEGVNQALEESRAIIAYVCNLVTKQGTYDFAASDFVDEIEKYLVSRVIDYVILNTKTPTEDIVDKYNKEDSQFVVPNMEGKKVIEADLLLQQPVGEVGDKVIVARHNSRETTRILMEILEGKLPKDEDL